MKNLQTAPAQPQKPNQNYATAVQQQTQASINNH